MSSLEERSQMIWQTLAAVPPGKVVTYGQLAELAGLPGRARLVGRVLKRLPAGSGLPWHRVINAQGRISFPAGSPGALEQRQRLQSEAVIFEGGRIDLARYRWQPEGVANAP